VGDGWLSGRWVTGGEEGDGWPSGRCVMGGQEGDGCLSREMGG
jgi:hypothetical protein